MGPARCDGECTMQAASRQVVRYVRHIDMQTGPHGEVPAATVARCGNYRDRGLFSAKQWGRDILGQGLAAIRSNGKCLIVCSYGQVSSQLSYYVFSFMATHNYTKCAVGVLF